MRKYDIKIRRGAFQENRLAGYKNYDMLHRRYKRARMRNLWVKIFYLLFLVGVSMALYHLFR